MKRPGERVVIEVADSCTRVRKYLESSFSVRSGERRYRLYHTHLIAELLSAEPCRRRYGTIKPAPCFDQTSTPAPPRVIDCPDNPEHAASLTGPSQIPTSVCQHPGFCRILCAVVQMRLGLSRGYSSSPPAEYVCDVSFGDALPFADKSAARYGLPNSSSSSLGFPIPLPVPKEKVHRGPNLL